MSTIGFLVKRKACTYGNRIIEVKSHLSANGPLKLRSFWCMVGHRKRNAELREELETQMNESAEKLVMELEKQANAHVEATEKAAL